MNLPKAQYTAQDVIYRELKGLNYSGIKLFAEDPKAFYEQFILGIPRKPKESYALKMGSLLDVYLYDCNGSEECFSQNFDKKFILFDGVKSTKQAFGLADELFEVTQMSLSEDGTVNVSFEDRFKQAFENIQAKEKYKGKSLDQGLQDFNDNAKDYFETLLKGIGKEVVDLKLIEMAKQKVEQVLGDEFMHEIFHPASHIQDLGKVVVEFNWESDYGDIECKCEIDKVQVDDKRKIIHYYDGKSTWDNENFDYMYLLRKYYLQNAFYHEGLINFRDKHFPYYEINAGKFIVMDTSPVSRRPLIYQTSAEHLVQGYEGFTHEGRKYEGLRELINDIMWAKQNNEWLISRENYQNRAWLSLKQY